MPRSGVKVRVRDRDLGWRKMMRDIAARPGYVEVGVRGDDPGDRESGIVNNVQLAAIHEFGLGVPERSFVRATVDRQLAAYRVLLRRLGNAMFRRRITPRAVLEALGLKAQADMVETIDNSIGLVPNAPATIREKGSSRPLIDTGALKQSITYRVQQ